MVGVGVALTLIGLFAWRRGSRLSGSNRVLFLAALFLKLAGGLAFGAVYLLYYGKGDTFTYFGLAKTLRQVIVEDPVVGLQLFFKSDVPEWRAFLAHDYVSDAQTYILIQIAALLLLVVGPSYWGLTLLLAALSFACAWDLRMVLLRRYPSADPHLSLVVLALPGVVFWASGLLKDTLAMACMYLSLAGMLQFANKNQSGVWRLLLGLPGLFLVRPYLFLAWAPFLFLSFEFDKAKNWRRLLPIAGLALIVTALQFTPFNLAFVLERAEATRYYRLQDALVNHEDAMTYDTGTPQVEPLAETWRFCKAWAAVYFRPAPSDAHKPIVWFGVFDMLLTVGYAAYLAFRIDWKAVLHQKPGLPLALLLFSQIYGLFIGLSSSFFGSLVRYKIYAVAPMLLAFALLPKKEKPPTSTN